MKRLGTVLVFKEGTTREEAAEALAQIGEYLELDYFFSGNEYLDALEDKLREFDDEYGGPVWYIP